MNARLEPLFFPRRIGVAGLSPRPATWGNRLVVNLGRGGFTGEILAVAPRSEVPVPSVADLDELAEPLDVLAVTVPAPAVPGVVARARETGKARSIIVYSAGFSEEGPDGARLEEKLVAAAGDVPLVGPNCLGLLSAPGRTIATISAYVDREHPPPGPVAIVSQSGALGFVMAAQFERRGVGLGTYVSVGNEACLGVGDFGLHLVERPDVRVLGLYIESVRDAGPLRALGRRAAELGKRVIALKAGISDAGQRATLSHTAAVAGDALLFHSLCAEAGIIRAESDDHFADLLHAAQLPGGLPATPGRRPRLAIASMSGGAGAILADRLAAAGVDVPPLTERTRERVAALGLDAIASDANPVDLGGGFDRDRGRHGGVFTALAEAQEIDGVVGVFTFGDRRADWYRELTAELTSLGVPGWMIWSAGRTQDQLGTPPGAVFDSIESFVRGLPAMREVTPPLPTPVPEPGRAEAALRALAAYDETPVLSEADAHRVVRELGVPYVPTVVAATPAELAAAPPNADAYVVKVDSPGVAHRAKLGLVRLGVPRGGLAAAGAELAEAARSQGIGDFRLVAQPQLEHRGELVIGAVRDPQYGPAMIIGAGGARVEDAGGYRHALLLPARPEAIAEVAAALADHYGGLDTGGLTALITATAELMIACPRLTELDVNPVLIRPDGSLTAVDALIIQGGGA
ncbi:MAG: CoA-binding protein [Streptosporangiales bacterium]|nr:CoA-binding protein [Streptosporangiales bacterium]